jgi:transcriptional antiterminator NusG
MSEEDRKWYVLRVISGKERKLKEYIDMEISRSGWDKTITQVLVPTEKVYKIKNGKRVIQERNFYPGYIMIEAIPAGFSGEMISTIKNMTGVIHFLGKETPIPLRKSEVNRILGKVDEMQEEGTSMNEPFIVGETVKIIDGPFNEFLGNIEEIHEEKKKLKVNVKIFGRKTPVELNFMQVEKQH